MHAALLGVVRQFVFLWFDSKSHAIPYYLGRHVQTIDELLLAIRPPSEIKRLPRSVSLRKYWKAAEFRNFLLFYSHMCLNQLLPNEFVSNWYLLIFAVNQLMMPQVSSSSITLCDLVLYKFDAMSRSCMGKSIFHIMCTCLLI